MTLDCYDFDAGQPRHFPAGSYYQQAAAAVGQMELDAMRLLWRCWLVFKFRNEGTWKQEDIEFAYWLKVTPPDNTWINRLVMMIWQTRAA
jgi:hypothetical protein